MGVNTLIQFRRGTAAVWTSGNPTLSQGELGFETDTGKFKIGRNAIAWNSLPYAGGSAITAGSGMCVVYDSGNNAYTLSSELFTSGSGISLSSTSCGAGSGNAYTISLNNRLQEVSKLSSSGIVVSTNSSGVVTRTITSGNNINISNGDGINGNPLISLATSLSGLTNITASSVSITGAGQALTVDNDVYIGGTLSAVQININGITASGNVGISGDLRVSGSGTFGSGLYVGGVPVSLSGHSHTYTDITNFCSGVASCVDTALVAVSGIQTSYSSGTNTLFVGLSGQALALHTYTGTGILVRTGDSSYVARTITNTDSNISVTNGNGASNNPIINLAQSINVGDITTTGNITIGGNLTVNGDTIVSNVSTIQVEDPIIQLGQGSGVISGSDTKDRGLELRYISGGVASTGFMGYDQSTGKFMILTNAVNSSEVFSGTSGTLSLGVLEASGTVTGRTLVSTVASGTAPLSVTSPTLVTNLNADLLDGNDGSYYTNFNNIGSRPSPIVSVNLTGDVTGSGQATLTNLSGNAYVNFSTTIPASSIILGTDTTGNYVAAVAVSGSGLSLSGSAGVGSTFTVISNASSASGNNTIVFRDGAGGFTAGAITGSTFTGNGSALTNLNASNLSTGTVPLARLPLASTTASGIAIFSSTNFSVDGNGLVTIKSSGISNNNLIDNTITIGSTAFTLGTTGTAISGLTSLSSTSVSGTNLYGNGSNITSLNASNINSGTIGVSYLPTGIPITNLSQSGLYFGNTSWFTALGGTVSILRELTAISGTSTAAPTTLINCAIDGGTP